MEPIKYDDPTKATEDGLSGVIEVVFGEEFRLF